MVDEHTLPDDLIVGATRRGNEYGWSIRAFPGALEAAEQLGYGCIGGQFQFRLPDATCEMYWLAADASDKLAGEDWDAYRRRSLIEVAEGFTRLLRETDFDGEASKWAMVRDHVLANPDLSSVLRFVAYFIAESEFSDLPANRAKYAGQS